MKLNRNISLRICCDGEAASGKTTGAKLISKKYSLHFLSSGLLYRYASYVILKHKPKNKIQFLKKIFKKLNYNSITRLNLHASEISDYTAILAKQKKVRLILQVFQKKFAKKFHRICIEGRDIASNILLKNPRYDVAFFFQCNIETTSYRRWKESRKFDKKVSLQEVKKKLIIRNKMDKNRRFFRLKRVEDAVLIRTDILDKSAMVTKMSKEIEKKLKEKYGRNL